MTSYHYPLGSELLIRVVLADPQAIVRQGVRALLDRAEGIEVIADTGDGDSLLALARERLPDVIVTEIHLSRMGGLEAARRMAAEGLPCQILFLTGNADRESVVSAFDAGVRGYVLKDTDFRCLERGIRAIHALESYLDPKVSELLIRQNEPSTMHDVGRTSLTGREQEVLRLLAEGNNSKDIGFILGISNKTVDTFRRNCMKKLRLRSNADLVKFALREGMVRL